MIVITSVIVLMAIGLLTMAICLVKQQKKLNTMDDVFCSSLAKLGKTVADLSDEVQGLSEDMAGVMKQVDTLGSQFQEGDPVEIHLKEERQKALEEHIDSIMSYSPYTSTPHRGT